MRKKLILAYGGRNLSLPTKKREPKKISLGFLNKGGEQHESNL